MRRHIKLTLILLMISTSAETGITKQKKVTFAKTTSVHHFASDDNNCHEKTFPPEVLQFQSPSALKKYLTTRKDEDICAVEIDVVLSQCQKKIGPKISDSTIYAPPLTHIDRWYIEGVDELYVTVDDEESVRPIIDKGKTLKKLYIRVGLCSRAREFSLSKDGPQISICYDYHKKYSCADFFRSRQCYVDRGTNSGKTSFCGHPHLLRSALYLITDDMTNCEKFSILAGLKNADPDERIRVAYLLRKFIELRQKQWAQPTDETQYCGHFPPCRIGEDYCSLIHTLSMVTNEAGQRVVDVLTQTFSPFPGQLDPLLPYLFASHLEEGDLLEGYQFNEEIIQIKYKERARNIFSKFFDKIASEGRSTTKIANTLNTLCIMNEDAEKYYFDVLAPLGLDIKYCRELYESDDHNRKWALNFLLTHASKLKDDAGNYIYDISDVLAFLNELSVEEQIDENANIFINLLNRGYEPKFYYSIPPMAIIKDTLEICEKFDVKDQVLVSAIMDDLEELEDIEDRVQLYLALNHGWIRSSNTQWGKTNERVKVSYFAQLSGKSRQQALLKIAEITDAMNNDALIVKVTNAFLEDWVIQPRKKEAEEEPDENPVEHTEEKLSDEAVAEVEDQVKVSPISSWKSYDYETRKKNNRLIRKKRKDNIPVEEWSQELQDYWAAHPEPSSLSRKTSSGKRHRKK